jgi:hypothetical protein
METAGSLQKDFKTIAVDKGFLQNYRNNRDQGEIPCREESVAQDGGALFLHDPVSATACPALISCDNRYVA